MAITRSNKKFNKKTFPKKRKLNRKRSRTVIWQPPLKNGFQQQKNTYSIKGSRFYGVYKCRDTNLYYMKIMKNNKTYKSKLFKKEIDAAIEYDNFIIKNKLNRNLNCDLNFFDKKYDNYFKNPKNPIKKTCVLKKRRVFFNLKKNKRPKIQEWVKNKIYAMQNEKCILCNNNLGEFRVMDHFIPRSLGGLDNINNYQALCGSCNKWKTYNFDHKIKEYFIENNINNNCIDINFMHELQFTEFKNFNFPL
jgi:5-methylcytosine-specific restriction endonuclease McrA